MKFLDRLARFFRRKSRRDVQAEPTTAGVRHDEKGAAQGTPADLLAEVPDVDGWQDKVEEAEHVGLERIEVEEKPPPEPLEPRSPRDMQLGLDFGTAWSKLLLRDLSRPGGEAWSMVIRPGPGEDYRFPSLVTLSDGKLWFGTEAAARSGRDGSRCFSSLKMRAAFPDRFYGPLNELPSGLSPRDLAMLEVLFLLQTGLRAAEAYAETKGCVPRMGFSLGVPMAYLDQDGPREFFHEIAITAFNLLRGGPPTLAEGLPLEAARDLVETGKRLLPPLEEWGRPEDWLRPEATAALMWVFNSPEIGPGLYAAIDVGAGTTSASFFSIVEDPAPRTGMRQKSRMAFFGVATDPPGLDKLDKALAEGIGSAN